MNKWMNEFIMINRLSSDLSGKSLAMIKSLQWHRKAINSALLGEREKYDSIEIPNLLEIKGERKKESYKK